MEQIIEEAREQSLDLVVESLNPGILTTNAKAIFLTVKNQLEKYRPENYSEENLKDAKRDKATLNAAATALNSKRLELERRFMEPFQEFKDLINETCSLIKTSSAKIDDIVKTVEAREKEKKRADIAEFFNSLGFNTVSLDRIFESAWLNKGQKLESVFEEVSAKVGKIKSDLAILEKIGEPEAQAYYLDTMNLDSAIAQAERIAANRKRLEEAKSLPPAEPFVMIHDEPAPPSEMIRKPEKAEPEMMEFTVRFRGTKSQIQALRQFVDSQKIQFEKLA